MPARRKKADTIRLDEVCPEHFPGGVPQGTATVGCEHGTFVIDGPAAPADDEGDGE